MRPAPKTTAAKVLWAIAGAWAFVIEHGLGVSSYESYAVKRLDSDYFAED